MKYTKNACFLRTIPSLGFYGLPSRAVLFKGKTWDVGQDLKIGFIGGTDYERNFVKGVYKELDFVNLNFIFTDNLSEADVRWSFVKGGGSWSYLGTDALFIDKRMATVNIGWDVELSVVRHELGHSLGLAHEHQNPEDSPNWNREQVIRDLSGPPNNWSLKEIEHNVFRVLDKNKVDFSPTDYESIMMYPFPKEWTLDGKGSGFNIDWSEGDKEMLKKYYPHSVVVDEASITIKLLSNLIDTESRLKRAFTEKQLMFLAEYLEIEASVDDLKDDTVAKLFKKIKDND